MKFVCISDLHGELPTDLPEGDYLLIAGDICDEIPKLGIEYQRNWWLDKFLPWINSLPYKEVIIIGGNHDGFIKRYLSHSRHGNNELVRIPTRGKLVYLEDNLYTTDEGVTIYGTPHCRRFQTWYFMADSATLKEIYEMMPEDVDILLCHDAPFGCSDICLETSKYNPNAYLAHLGNEELREIILKRKPKYVIHGHLHSANHEMEELGSSKVYCVSILNEQYELEYPALILEI